MFPLWGPQASAPTFWAEGWVRIQAKVAGRNPDSIFAASTCLLDLGVRVGCCLLPSRGPVPQNVVC